MVPRLTATGPATFIARLTGILDRAGEFPRRLFGPAILRVFLGAAALLLLLGDYGNRHAMWGDGAEAFRSGLSLLSLSESDVYFELVFHGGIVVSLLFALYGGRVLGLAFSAVVLSFYRRNIAILDGGDNLVQLIALLLPFMITDAHVSLRAPSVRRRLAATSEPTMSFAFHNVACAVVMFQTAVVYVSAGLWKVVGAVWRHGIALDFVASSERFGLSGQFRWLMGNAVLVTVFTYATIVVQLVLVPLLLSRSSNLRILGVAAVAMMHVGIMVMMGLVGFAINMLGADSVFLRDDEYAAKVRRLRTSLR